jgi:hypothetical protein
MTESEIGEPADPIAHMVELGWKVEGPFYATAPTPKSEYRKGCSDEVDDLIFYLLKTVIIKDTFGADHSARREFERQNPDIGTFSSKYSKLGLNRLSFPIYAMEYILKKVGKAYPSIEEKLKAAARLAEISQEIGGYRAMTLEEKIDFAKKVDATVYQFLQVLSE